MGKFKLDLEDKEGSRWKALVIPVILVLFFLLAFTIRSAFYWPPAAEPVDKYGEEGYLLSGNDPNYHKRVADYVQDTHSHLVFDNMLDFPRGSPNPNPPLYSWSIALMGYLISPFFGGNVQQSTWYVMEFAAAFWASLTVFPVYVFTRDMFGKKPGIFAAFFIAVMAGNVERTPVGFSDHDAFVVFFVVLSFLFLMRALRMLNNRKYVKDYFNARSLAIGFQELVKENKKALLYTALAGLSITAVALSWKGVVYIYAIILVYYVFHLSIKKLKKEEGLGIALIILFALGLSLLLSFPYYSIKYFTGWFESPFFVFTAMAILTMLLVPTRDIPWLIVVPVILVLLVGGMFTLKYLFPDIMDTIISLQGYFLKTKLYETIAEAQAPDFSRMVFSYGVITFYLALIGAGIAAYRLPAEKWRNDYIVTVMWAIVAIYMAMSAVRFMYNATPVFAIFSGWITYEFVKLSGFDKMLRSYRGLSSEPFYAFRKSVKVRHVLTVLFVMFLIIWPNFWYGFDAGVPYEEKGRIDQKIYDHLPGPLRPDEDKYEAAGKTWWLGSFGTAYPSDYWVDGMFWLADQDADELPEERPAFISWWDYGHWAVHMGQHPAAADNFQNGFQWAGNYITAQNESIAIALVTSKIIEGTMFKDDTPLDILENYVGQEKRDTFVDYYYNPMDYKKEVLDNPHIYGPRDRNRMDANNVKYLMMSRMLTMTLDLEELVNLLHDIEVETGYSMRYFAVDSRLLPVGPTNTGIYYAPTKLSDQNIDDFLQVIAIGNDGSRTNVQDQKAMEERYNDPDFKITKYEIEYKDMFYNSMFYKAYIGWTPIDVEINEPGIPTISRPDDVGRTSLEIQGMPPIQGWGMTHHRLEYRTQYWNPNKTNPQDHPADWEVISPSQADVYRNMSEDEDPEVADRSGIIDTTYRGLYAGVFFLKYYDGAYINGTITLEDGTPLPGARVTVYDDLELANTGWPGAPHGYTHTDEDGHYSIVAPYGNVTVRVSNGGQDPEGQMRTYELLMQMEKRVLNDTVIEISDNQAMRMDEDADGDGIWDYNIKHNVVVNVSKLEGRAYWDLDDNDVFEEEHDEPMVGYIGLLNSTYGHNYTTEIDEVGNYSILGVVPDDYELAIMSDEEDEDYFYKEFRPVDELNHDDYDIQYVPAMLNGTLVNEDNDTLPGVKIYLSNRTGSVGYETETDEDGLYTLDRILPGNYTLKVQDVRYISSAIDIDIDEGIHNTTNISLTSTVKVTGDAVLPDGSPASNALLVFKNLDDDSMSVQVSIKADGKLDGHVPPGQYCINGKVIKDHSTYVFMRTMTLEEAKTPMDIPFVRAYRINGTMYKDMNDNDKYDPLYGTTSTGTTTNPESGSGSGDIDVQPTPGPAVFSESKANIMVEFEDVNGNISLLSNAAGYYEVYLSEGDHVVYSYVTTPDQNMTGLVTLNVDRDQVINFTLDDGTRMEGSVFHDKNQNGILDEGEELAGAKMTFLDLEGNSLVRYTNDTGHFGHLLPSVEYNLSVWYDGYILFAEDLEVQGESLHKNIILKPENITVNGMVGFDKDGNGVVDPDEGLAVSIRLTPEGGPFAEENKVVDIETNETGMFNIDVFPQNYTVTIDETITPEDRTGARYKYDDYLNLSIGHGTEDLAISLDQYFKVSGDIFYDGNGDGILNSGERRSPVIEFYTTDGDRIDADITPDGYEIYLQRGTYYYYTHVSDSHSMAGHVAALGVLAVKEETEKFIKLLDATRVNGVVYFDENENGDVDTGEQERDVEVRLTRLEAEVHKGTIATTSNDIGEYSIYVPWGYNYSTTVDMVDDRDLHNIEYTVKFAYTTLIVSESGRKNTMEDLPVDEFYLVSGNVTYQAPDAPVNLSGAQVIFDEFRTVTILNGSYELYVRPGEYAAEILLPGFELPESVFGNRTIDYKGTLQDFVMDPVNVTVEGHVYVDHNKDGVMDQRTESIKATIEFISADIWAVNASTVTDSRGTFVLDLDPGAYHVWISADEGLHHYVIFENFSLKASGDVEVLEFELKEGVTLQGEVYYDDTDGVRHTPLETNITVLDKELGAEKMFKVNGRQFTYHLPTGDYHFTAKVTDNEYDQDMEYILDTEVNLTERTKSDMVFEKVKLYYLDIEWDESERVTLPQNGSVTYSISVTNVGNEPATFDIDGTPPGGWETKTSVEEVTLAIGKSTDFTVLINVSEEARAGKNTVTIRSKYNLNDDFANSTPVYVDVIQVFNISIEVSDNDPSMDEIEGYYTYYVNLVNHGNGNDKVNITTLSNFPSWEVTFSEPNPLLSEGQTKEIEIRLEPEDALNMTGREMTLQLQATSQTGQTAEYELVVTFPDLAGSLQVNGPGVKSKKDLEGPRRIPGFEVVFVVAAIVVVVMYRRRDPKGGVDR